MIEKFVNLCEHRNFEHLTNFDDDVFTILYNSFNTREFFQMFMVTEDEIDDGHEVHLLICIYSLENDNIICV